MVKLVIAPKGLAGIIVSETGLSHVDGENGKLIYCGYDIEELLNCSYEEICYLLLYGELPNQGQLEIIEDILKTERVVPKFVLDFIANKAKKNHPMAILRSSISMLSVMDYDLENMSENNLKSIGLSLISKTATIAAAICRVRNGLKILPPKRKLGHAANFLQMSKGEQPEDIIARTLDAALVLHADHSFNASTFTNRVVASSLSDLISSITAAIGSLKGSLHGGANTAVMKMLLEIGEVKNVKPWLDQALARKDKIMGFGHRVYKVLDPRAKPLKQMSKEWSERVGNIKWFNISENLEALMREKKGINANVDFYSATTYYAMGIQPEMFTVIFAMARVLGWVAHYIEQMQDNRIMRPVSSYIGPKGKLFMPIQKRK